MSKLDFIKKIIKDLLPAGLDYIIKRLQYPSLSHRKYCGLKPAGGYKMGYKMQECINYIEKGTSIIPKNIFEIGANLAQDADYLKEYFRLDDKDIFVFEAHPELCKVIKKIHKFNTYNNAVYNEEKEIKFNLSPLNADTGSSSIFVGDKNNSIIVDAIRMDNFMQKNCISEIDFLKIDVEGGTYHVLEGFGKRIVDIKCIQLEAEHNGFSTIPYEKISELLLNSGFELVLFKRNMNNVHRMRQSDSFWVKRECVKYK